MDLQTVLLILAILGGLDLAFRALELIFSSFGPLLAIKTKAWNWLSDIATIPVLRRKAVATRVEGVLNQTAYRLQQFLPKGWVKRARVRWVRKSSTPNLIQGEVVLRIRPDSDPDQNLMQALWLYFRGALFPSSHDVLSDDTISAIALAITRAGLEEHHPYLLDTFDEVFLNAAELNDTALGQFSDCVRLNEYGLLMGPFVREVDRIANTSRFSADRTVLQSRILSILDHMLGFQPLLRFAKPDDEWRYQEGETSYAFLLVSRPPEVRPDLGAYVDRVQAHVRRGVDRIYVIGRNEERSFVHDVIAAILSIRELKGLEIYPLLHDYRGDARGIGASLARDELLAELSPPRRSLDFVTSDNAAPRDHEDDVVKRELATITEDLVVKLSDYEGSWIPLSAFGNALRDQLPDFTPERYGGRNLMSVLKKLGFLEFDERGPGPAKAVYIRMASNYDKTSSKRTMSPEEAAAKVVEIVKRRGDDESGWLFLGVLGHYLSKECPELDYTVFGADSLHEYVSRIPGLELEERGEGRSKTYVRVPVA